MATIVSFAHLKTMLDLSESATSYTDYPDLKLVADSVHSALEHYVGRTLNTVAKMTETGFSQESVLINLGNIPISSITSVTVDSVVLTSDEYTINEYGLTLLVAPKTDWTVISKGGFKTIPEDVYRAELSQIVYEYQNMNNMAATSFTNDGGGVSLPGFVLLPQVRALLDNYKHMDKFGL